MASVGWIPWSRMAHSVLAVLPTLGDRLETLEAAIRSVIDQKRDVDVRLVVVAPPSAIEARRLAESVGATIVDDPKSGLAGAMNAGVSARDGESFYVGLGDDDLLREGGLRHLLDLAEKNPEAVVYFGACDYIDGDDRTIGVSRAGRLATMILAWGPDLIPHPGTLIRLDALEKVGSFDAHRRYAMDLDAFLKLKRVGRFVSTKRSVAAFRWHADSLTVSGRAASAKDAMEVKQAHLPAWLRPISAAWLVPVSWATEHAGKLVNGRARRLGR